ncbi:MAG: isochorismate synthase [Microcystaceae cyanobacterium]
MSVAVPAIPTYPNLLEDEQELYQFLLTSQESLRANQNQVFNFSRAIAPVDLLKVLAAISPQNCVHFYGENREQEEALLGYGVSQDFSLINNREVTDFSKGDRFSLAQQFIENCFKEIIILPGQNSLILSPQIFCSFSFFDTGLPTDPFPNAFLFLPQIQLTKKLNKYFLSCNICLNKTVNLKFLIKQIYRQIAIIKQARETNYNLDSFPNVQTLVPIPVNSQAQIQQSIQSILQAIKEKQLGKVVLAQALDLLSPQNFQIEHCLHHLRTHYSDCYLFSIGNGKGDCFIGASPERLLSIKKSELITDALAGSAPRGKTPQKDAHFAHQLLQSQKERHEHQAVIEFILQQLTELGLTPQESPLKLLKLSNIQHLWTPIYAHLPAHLHPLEIIAKLHPTPAVAGVPTQAACEMIKRHENFARSLYASPLGWVDYEGNSEFIVGIRSALITENKARLFAGAGIVAGSEPAREVAEINLKLETLLKTLV